MIKNNKVKVIAKEDFHKIIGKKALDSLDKLVVSYVNYVLKKASRRSDLAGRKVIKDEDIQNTENNSFV